MLELNQLYNMDCMEGMKEFPDGFFDLAIVDPPYGIKWSRENLSLSGIRKDGSIRRSNLINWRKQRPTGYKTKDWDNQKPKEEYFKELFRISKKQVVCGGNYFSNLPQSNGWVVWDKKVFMPSLSKCELLWTSFLGHTEIFYWQWSGMLKQGEMSYNKETRIHPTQKPVALYTWLLKNYAKPGDKILDTHVGSASSLIACYDLGFDYVGFELDKDYYAAAQARIAAHRQQTRLFDAVPEEPVAVAV